MVNGSSPGERSQVFGNSINYGFGADSIIVTGAASGIGRETALEALRQGLHVFAWDRDAAGLKTLVAEARTLEGGKSDDRLATYVVDITDADAVKSAMADAGEPAPRFLVNNAGPPSGADLTFADGLGASLVATREITSLWLAQGPTEPVAVNVASIAGNLVGTSEWYSAAKAGIAGYTRYLATARPGGLRVNAVAPGLIDTPRLAATLGTERGNAIVMRNPLRRAGHAEEVAMVILFLLSPGSSLVHGALIVCDGGTSVVL